MKISFVVRTWTFLTLSVALFGCGPDTETKDTSYVSPDRAYVAIVRDMDTGAAGSNSQIVLKAMNSKTERTNDQEYIVADGDYKEFHPIVWTGPRTLQITNDIHQPSPRWKTRWLDVKIVYK